MLFVIKVFIFTIWFRDCVQPQTDL